MHSGTFWNLLEHFECILEHSAYILEHSGTFWNILDVVEGCRKVYVQVDDRQTDRQTDTQTLGLVELRLRS